MDGYSYPYSISQRCAFIFVQSVDMLSKAYGKSNYEQKNTIANVHWAVLWYGEFRIVTKEVW